MGKLGVEKIPSLYFVLGTLLNLIHITPFTQERVQIRNFIPNIQTLECETRGEESNQVIGGLRLVLA
jgi:hypothetical protein